MVRSPDQMDCGKEITNIEESSQTKKALLLQKLSYIKSTAIQCSLRRSTLPFRCGDHSHATIVTHNIRLSQEIRLTKEECSTYYETNLYETASHPYEGGVRYTDHLIRMNATNVINYHSYGMTYYSSGNTWCYGADDYYEVSGSPGRESTNKIVEYTIDELEMREVTTLISTEGVVSLFDEEQQLPTDRCSVSAGGCSEQHATWIWNNPTSSDECLMRKAREIEVNVTTVVEADGTVKDLLIDNGRAIYLEKRDPTMDCGQLIYETNHRDLFVTFVTDYPPFHRAVPSSMMRWNIYSDLSDSYLAHFMEQRHMEMTHAVSSAICETEKKMTEKQFSILAARQNAAMSQETIGLGQGQFATASGEAWPLYRCKEIIVTALDLDECYDSLPVRLEQSDREDRMVVERAKQRLLVKEGLAEPSELVPLDTLQYFREPVTGIITAQAEKMTCVPQLPQYYRNRLGGWVQVTPAVQTASPPALLSSALTRIKNWVKAKLPDFSYGGLYTPEALARMNDYLLMPRLKTSFINTITSIDLGPMVRRSSRVGRRIYDTFEKAGLWTWWAKIAHFGPRMGLVPLLRGRHILLLLYVGIGTKVLSELCVYA